MDNTAWLLLAAIGMTACSTPFESMWQGLATCELTDLYIDSDSGRSANAQLNRYTPYKQQDVFFWYKVKEDLHGVPISGFVIPSSTFEVHVLFVDTPIDSARLLLQRAYGSSFSDEQRHREGSAPLLLRDPRNSKRAMLDCTRVESDEELTEPPLAE